MVSVQALEAARDRLQAADTVVTHRDGTRSVERSGTTVGTLPPPDVLPPALQPERKRPCLGRAIELPCEPTWALPSFEGLALPAARVASLRIVTWNVFFSPLDADQRIAALFSEALSTQPDVIALQEVVPELARSIRACTAVSRVYAVSPNVIEHYGTLLLVRHEFRAQFTELAFPTNMGRSLLVAHWRPPLTHAGVAVATTHLESLNNAPTRAKQLKLAASALQSYETAILCGDFNFDSTREFGEWRRVPPRPPRPRHDESSDEEYAGPSRSITPLENAVLARHLPGYIDAWAYLRPGELGHTFDGASNPYVADPGECMRYDRVMVRGASPSSISMLGTRHHAATEQADAVVPSDHYGLVAELRTSGPQPPATS